MFYFNRLLYFPGSVSHTADTNKSRLLCFVELFRSLGLIMNRLFINVLICRWQLILLINMTTGQFWRIMLETHRAAGYGSKLWQLFKTRGQGVGRALCLGKARFWTTWICIQVLGYYTTTFWYTLFFFYCWRRMLLGNVCFYACLWLCGPYSVEVKGQHRRICLSFRVRLSMRTDCGIIG